MNPAARKEPSRLLRNPAFAFTLIELLTVIAIIGILAAILIPVVASVREQGRATVCRNNLRQLYLATALYANDHDDRFPLDGSGIGTWSGRISPYFGVADLNAAGGHELFHCPSRLDDTVDWHWWQSHHGINYLLSGPWYSPWMYGEGRRFNDIGMPSMVMLYQDNSHRNRAAMPWATRAQPSRIAEMFVHGGKTNLVFVDGHVAAMPREEYPLDHNRVGNLEDAPRPFGYK